MLISLLVGILLMCLFYFGYTTNVKDATTETPPSVTIENYDTFIDKAHTATDQIESKADRMEEVE